METKIGLASNKIQHKCTAFAWDDVIKEVMKRKASGEKANLFNYSDEAYEKRLSNKSHFTRYKLGAKYGDTYFTKREADCMACLLKIKKVSHAAALLGISIRTLEGHVKQMKAKIGCRTKLELINLVRASKFMRNVNLQKRT